MRLRHIPSIYIFKEVPFFEEVPNNLEVLNLRLLTADVPLLPSRKDLLTADMLVKVWDSFQLEIQKMRSRHSFPKEQINAEE